MNKTQNRIKIFSYHGCIELGKQRNNSPAADTKIDYIIRVLNRLGYGVDLISKAPSAEAHYIPAYVETKGCNTYRYFASFGKTQSLLRIINKYFLEFQFFFWCLLNLRKREQIIVYHSLGYDSTFIKLKTIKSIRIIGEIEEIYQDVSKKNKKSCKNEYKFINICDKFIFPTQLLNQSVNKSQKPSLVIHGVYAIEPKIENKFTDGKIHVVYGGTLDPNKGGAVAAAQAAEFLPPNYHIHICGFGNPTQIKSIISEIQKKSKAQITFEGELNTDVYKHFIQKCHIGLSTQNPDAAFNATSFPSKILMYLSNGLKVVSIKIPVIKYSAIANCLFFYTKQEPSEIAKAILNASELEQDGSAILRSLEKKFEEDLLSLIAK